MREDLTRKLDLLDSIAEKAERAKELRYELRRSLALEGLWPGCFDGENRPRVCIAGNPYSVMWLRVAVGDEVRTWKVRDVPLILVERELQQIARDYRNVATRGGNIELARLTLKQHPELAHP